MWQIVNVLRGAGNAIEWSAVSRRHEKAMVFIAVIGAGITAGRAGGAAQPQSSDLVIRDITIVSPERAVPLEHAFVRIRDGRVADVTVTPISADRYIEGAGRFLVPGLIDSHVHLAEVAGMQFAQIAALPELANAARVQTPRSYLYFGFTTVVDMNGRAEAMARWRQAAVRPDAHFCGAAPVANGFPMSILPAEVRLLASSYFLYDPRQAYRMPASIDPAAHTPGGLRLAGVDGRRLSEGSASGRGRTARAARPVRDAGRRTLPHDDDIGWGRGGRVPSPRRLRHPTGISPVSTGGSKMDRLIASGVSLPQLLRAMTSDNARQFGLDRDLGTIEPGNAIEQVILAGRVLPRETLSALNP